MNFLEKYGLKILLILFLIVSYSITAQTKKLLILGDSISAGYGIKKSENWVTILESNLNSSTDNQYIIINASVSGDTTSGGVSRINKALDFHSPNYVLIELGGNDALRGYPVTIIKNNLEEIIKSIVNRDARPLLMQIKIPRNYGKRYVEAFEKIYEELSVNYQIPLLDFMLDDIAFDNSLMQADGIHPNRKAQPLIASKMEEMLIDLLK
tara:strand:- start:3260 stop:3889 length:630 start_codon:yes stop_codon:yes gene_type:complete